MWIEFQIYVKNTVIKIKEMWVCQDILMARIINIKKGRIPFASSQDIAVQKNLFRLSQKTFPWKFLLQKKIYLQGKESD